jgi:hypothetical protein
MSVPLHPAAHIIDLRTDTELVLTFNLPEKVIGTVLDGAGTLRVAFFLPTPEAAILITAFGGPTYQGPPKAYLLEVTDQYVTGNPTATVWDSAMWVESATITLGGDQAGIILDGKDIFDGYSRSYIDRVTFTGVSAEAILSGLPGTIPVPVGSLAAPGYTLPHQKGLLQSVPGFTLAGQHHLAFTGNLDPNLRHLLVTMDVNGDSIARAITTLLQALAGYYQVHDPAPFGARQHYTVDVPSRTVWAGYVGAAPAVTLLLNIQGYALDETLYGGIVGDASFQILPHLEDCRAQDAFLGGSDNHGMPDGGRITGIAVYNPSQAPVAGAYTPSPTAIPPVDWNSSLLIVGISTGNEGGGVYYLIDKHLYPMSQPMDVAALALVGGTIYAATTMGVLTGTFSPIPVTYTRLGGLIAPVADVQAQASVGVTAIVTSGGAGSGSAGVYVYPQIANDGDSSVVGYAGWSRVVADDVTTAARVPTSFNGMATAYASTSDPSTLLIRTDGTEDTLRVPLTGSLTRIYQSPYPVSFNGSPPAYNFVFFLTSAGSLGMRYHNAAADIPSPDPTIVVYSVLGAGRQLGDRFGSLVVADLIAYPPGWSINGANVALLAATDNGVYFTTDGTGGGQWFQAGGPNSLDTAGVSRIAAGTIQTVIDQQIVRLFAASDHALLVSSTGGQYFQDVLAQELDLGPAWYAMAQRNGGTPWPDNQVGALLTGSAPAKSPVGGVPLGPPAGTKPDDPRVLAGGGAGTAILVAPTDPIPLGPTIQFCRRRNERNEFSYRVVDPTSPAPYAALEPAELVQMSADDARDAITAADQLLLEHLRHLSLAARQKVTIRVSTGYTTADAALRKVKCGDQVALEYALSAEGYDHTMVTVCTLTAAQPWYVMKKTSTQQQGFIQVDLELANIAAFATPDLQEIVSGVADGNARDRRYRGWRVSL